MTSGCSGLPKLRQFTRATARAPAHAMFTTDSTTSQLVPIRGSVVHQRGLASVDIARQRALGGSPGPETRSTAASPPGGSTVFKNSWWSYWR